MTASLDLTAQSVASQLSGAPAFAEVAMRLTPLDDATLVSVVKSDRDGFAQWTSDGKSLAQYLRNLAQAIDGISGRVDNIGNEK
jgi:hypothetical protein